MKRTRTTRVMLAAVLGALLVAQASAQSSGGPYRIESVVMAGGGGPIAGENYQITSTLGQPVTTVLAGAGYTILGGFWGPVGGFEIDSIFASGFEAN